LGRSRFSFLPHTHTLAHFFRTYAYYLPPRFLLLYSKHHLHEQLHPKANGLIEDIRPTGAFSHVPVDHDANRDFDLVVHDLDTPVPGVCDSLGLDMSDSLSGSSFATKFSSSQAPSQPPTTSLRTSGNNTTANSASQTKVHTTNSLSLSLSLSLLFSFSIRLLWLQATYLLTLPSLAHTETCLENIRQRRHAEPEPRRVAGTQGRRIPHARQLAQGIIAKHLVVGRTISQPVAPSRLGVMVRRKRCISLGICE